MWKFFGFIVLLNGACGYQDAHISANAGDPRIGNNTSGGGGSLSRSKRNGETNPDNLLASCQITNLLLYQALQQQRQVNSNPLLALATSNLQGLQGLGSPGLGSLNPLALGAGISPQHLLFPSLQTYTTTSTYVTKLTTTALVTVPLLFGNKPFSTTITRTKTYDVTTSEIKTLTSTITPTLVVPAIAPTRTATATVEKSLKTLIAPPVDKDVDTKESTDEVYDEGEGGDFLDPHQTILNDVHGDKSAGAGKKKAHSRTTQVLQDHKDKSKPASVPRGSTTFSNPPTEKKRKIKSKPATIKDIEDTQGKRRYYPQEEEEVEEEDASTRVKPSKSQRYSAYEDEEEDGDYYANASPPSSYAARLPSKKKAPVVVQDHQFYNRQYGGVGGSSAAEPDSYTNADQYPAAQYQDDYGYYTKRLKRGEQPDLQGGELREEDEEEVKLDREYLLEPSSDGDFSGNYQKFEKCPPIAEPHTVTVTITEMRTITKYLKGQVSATESHQVVGGSSSSSGVAAGSTTQRKGSRGSAQTISTPSPTTTTSRSRRGSLRRNNGEQSTTTRSSSTQPTESGSTSDPRAQILRRGKSRFNPSQDYEFYNSGRG